jgi:general secretion pathway protein G
MAANRRSAFTLIEVLIVVIIAAVLAATIIPQFSSSAADVRISSLKFHLHTIRSQIELYRIQHNNTVPTLAGFSRQMTRATNSRGATTCCNLNCGPYFQGEIPVNPFNNSNALVATAATTEGAAKATVSGTAGWQYNASTGGFYPNNAEYYVASP